MGLAHGIEAVLGDVVVYFTCVWVRSTRAASLYSRYWCVWLLSRSIGAPDVHIILLLLLSLV